ncbi:hypothetical protein JZU56_04415, partial [bacterium]|nr:hypothetical protein [bacterium]
MNPLGAPAAMLGESTDQLYAKDNFDVTDPLQRKAAFEDSTVGKWASGLTDAVPTIFADPLIFGGKALKITRIKYLDNPLRYAANRV